jgi:pimeloyl-ACP methyl ester carboxylesterase
MKILKTTNSIKTDYEMFFDIYEAYKINQFSFEKNTIFIFNGANSSKERWSDLFIKQIFEKTKINEIIIYNYRGINNEYGQKIKKINDYQLDLLANDFHNLLQYLYKNHWTVNNLNIYLLGYSFGGFILQEFINKFHLKHLKGIIFIATGCYSCYDINIKNYAKYYIDFRNSNNENNSNNDKDYLIYYQIFPLISKRILQRKKCIFKNENIRDIPFLYLTCENDELFQYNIKQDCILQNYKNIFHVPLKNMSHGIMSHHPDIITRLSVDFFNKI